MFSSEPGARASKWRPRIVQAAPGRPDDRFPDAQADPRVAPSNRFLKICNGVCSTPPRLPTLMALAVHRSHFVEGELIYAAQDYPFSMFLVLQGTFAFVAKVIWGEGAALISGSVFGFVAILSSWRTPRHVA